MYIIHGSQSKTLIQILRDGYITNKPPRAVMSYKKHPKQIFTQLTYRGIPNQEIQRPFWHTTCIVLDPNILRDFPFYATRIGQFKDRFQNGLRDPDTLAKGTGQLDKLPDLSHIKKNIDRAATSQLFGSIGFIHSHEILFGRRIYLERYCKCIVVHYRDPKLKQIQQLCDKRGIPLKITHEYSGIDKFIDLIESERVSL